MTNDPFLGVGVQAARRAAAVIIDAARDLKRRPSHATNRGEMASDAGAEAENAMIATLRGAFPDHAIVGKEAGEIVNQIQGGSSRGRRAPTTWIIDPIDGLINFRHGYPHYAVSIALARGDEITLAVVLDPVHDELFAAVKGKGAQRNGTPLRTSPCIRLDQALVGTVVPPHGSGRMPAYLAIETALAAQCGDIRRAGAGQLDLAYVAAGRLDGFFVLGRNVRDFAAGALIVDEASGRVGDFAGGVDFHRTNELIAAAPGVFNSLREAIAAAAPSR